MNAKKLARCLLILILLWIVFGVFYTHAQTKSYVDSVQRQIYQDILRKHYGDSVRKAQSVTISDLQNTVKTQDSLLNNAGGIIYETTAQKKAYMREVDFYKEGEKQLKRENRWLKGQGVFLMIVILLISM
jgi:hypothetical protein